jgi:hypothetical protein
MQICIDGLAPAASKIIQPVVSVTAGYDVFAASHRPTLVTSTYGLATVPTTLLQPTQLTQAYWGKGLQNSRTLAGIGWGEVELSTI